MKKEVSDLTLPSFHEEYVAAYPNSSKYNYKFLRDGFQMMKQLPFEEKNLDRNEM
jgi:hypothetical protein